MRILVTGGAGYIGSVLVPMLEKEGYEIDVMDAGFFGELYVTKDIRDVKRKDFKDADCVIDLACISNDPACDLDPKLTESININGAIRIALMAKKAGVKRYIYSSTCSVYGEGVHKGLTEESPVNPLTLYAKSKLTTEQILLNMSDTNFKVVALRNGTVFGYSPNMRFDLVVNQMTRDAWCKGVLNVNDGTQFRPNIHIKDVCDAIIGMIPKEFTGVYNAGGLNRTVSEIAGMVKQIFGCKIKRNPDAIDKRNYSVDSNKIRALGFYPKRSIYEGIIETKQALEARCVNPYDPKSVRVSWYKTLREQGKL